nr:WRKY transcription factor [Rehmannia glutinosa]
MENVYPTIFHSSSSTTPQTSHLPLLMNMANSDHAQLDGQFQDHKPNIGYMGLITNRSAASTINNNNTSTTTHHAPEEYATPAAGKKSKGDHQTNKSRKPKYAFQTRSQVDILDDGYRWRKYGQKAVKNNKFPRSYYRCTHQGCNVKKQIQRLSKDEGIVVTTYEGMHSHPIEKSTDNFEHILSQMQIYTSSV